MRWFVLRVQGRHVERIIATIGTSHCWRPTEKHWTKPARKHKPIQVEKPLIPGWLFVHEDQYGLWDDLTGVHGALKYGRLGPVWIEDEELNGLRSACDSVPDEPEGQPEGEIERIPVGTPVRLRGILYGRSGTLTGYTREGYARVDLGSLEVTVATKLVERT